jgi:NAD(P) transhydrogenase
VEHVDLLVIGSGPAGQKGAIQAAKLGRRVVLVERGTQVGGVTVHTGTIPSKTLREAVLYLSGWKERSFYGRGYRLKRDIRMADLTERLHQTIAHEIEVIRDQLFRNGVDVVDGEARFVDPHVLEVTDAGGRATRYRADKVLVCVGTRPVRPGHIPFGDARVLDSDGLLEMKKLPRSLTIVGAGVVGVEYATIFGALDVKVALVDRRDHILGFLDREIGSTVEYLLRDRGMVLRLGEMLRRVEVADDAVVTHLESGKQLRSDVLLMAAGRVGCTERLGLENAGLAADAQGRLAVDEHYRTRQEHIYAAGDVIGFPSLASTSMEQGRLAACHAFGQGAACSPPHVPYGVYAIPEISMIGATEQELRADGRPYEVGVARFRETARGQVLGVEHGFLKMLFDPNSHRVLGVHILGEGATELVHIGQAALILGGTLEYFVENVFNYPTLAEAYKVAALDAWNRMPRLRPAAAARPSSVPADVPARRAALLRDVPDLPDAAAAPATRPAPGTMEQRTTGASPSA